MSEKLNFLWQAHSNICEWIRFSDTKAGAILAIHTFIWGCIAAGHETAAELYVQLKGCSETWSLLVLIVFCVFSAASAFLSLLSISPTLNVGEATSHIYFGHVAARKAKGVKAVNSGTGSDQYIKDILSLNANQQEREVASQIWANSIVSWRKFAMVTWSIRFLWGSLFMLMMIVVSLLITRAK